MRGAGPVVRPRKAGMAGRGGAGASAAALSMSPLWRIQHMQFALQGATWWFVLVMVVATVVTLIRTAVYIYFAQQKQSVSACWWVTAFLSPADDFLVSLPILWLMVGAETEDEEAFQRAQGPAVAVEGASRVLLPVSSGRDNAERLAIEIDRSVGAADAIAGNGGAGTSRGERKVMVLSLPQVFMRLASGSVPATQIVREAAADAVAIVEAHEKRKFSMQAVAVARRI